MSQVAAPVAVPRGVPVVALTVLQESLLFRRSAAFVIDVAIVFALASIPERLWGVGQLALAGTLTTYFVLVPVLFSRSPGMWLAAVTVVSDGGGRPGWIRLLIRCLAFAGLPAFTILMEHSSSSIACMVNEYVGPVWVYIAVLGLLPALFTKERRAFHEILSGTQTVPMAKGKKAASASGAGSIVPLRIAAFLIDLTPWLIVNEVLSLCNVTFVFSGLLLGACLILTTGLWGTSPGLWATGLGVRKGNRGGAPGIPRAVVRFALFLGPFLIAHWICWTAHADWLAADPTGAERFLCFALLSAGLGLLGPGRRGFHDRASGTSVVPVANQTLPRLRNGVAAVCILVVVLDVATVRHVTDWYDSLHAAPVGSCRPGPVRNNMGIRSSGTGLPWAGNEAESPAELYELYRDRVVRISVSFEYRRWWYARTEYLRFCGSGLIVANDDRQGLVLTNRHVVDTSFSDTYPRKKDAIDDLEITVSNPNSRYRVQGNLVALSKGDRLDESRSDLALLVIPLRGWQPGAVPIAALESIRPGEDAVAIGCPYGLDFSISEGLIAQLRPDDDAVQTSCPISNGNSGGPLILCKGGALAGVNTTSIEDEGAQNINFAIRADVIADATGWNYQGEDEKTARRLLGMLRVERGEQVRRCRRTGGSGGRFSECAGDAGDLKK